MKMNKLYGFFSTSGTRPLAALFIPTVNLQLKVVTYLTYQQLSRRFYAKGI